MARTPTIRCDFCQEDNSYDRSMKFKKGQLNIAGQPSKDVDICKGCYDDVYNSDSYSSDDDDIPF